MSVSNIYPSGKGACRVAEQLHTANWLSGVMVSVLRQYFGSTERISLEKANLLWNPEIEKSQVHIDVVDNIKQTEGMKFPKILVDLEAQDFPKDSIGDLDNFDAASGQRNYTVRSIGAFSIECWGLKKLEAWSISDEVRYFISTYRKEISQTYCFRYLRPVKAEKPVMSRIYDNYWIARLIVEFDTAETWGVLEEQLAVSDFSLKLQER